MLETVWKTIWAYQSPRTASVTNTVSSKIMEARDLYLDDAIVEAPTDLVDDRPSIGHFQQQLDSLIKGLKGTTVLVLLPTENHDKAAVLKSVVPAGISARFEIVKAGSHVGEQPYNSTGPQGAMNRISSSLEDFLTLKEGHPSAEEFCSKNNIGKILVVAIENYIRGNHEIVTTDLKTNLLSLVPEVKGDSTLYPEHRTLSSPVDYGLAVLYSPATSSIFHAHSQGVKIPRPSTETEQNIDFVAYAHSKGFVNGNENHGAQTVGKVIQAFVEPDPQRDYNIGQNWHADVTGGKKNRYDLLEDAIAKVRAQAEDAGVFEIERLT